MNASTASAGGARKPRRSELLLDISQELSSVDSLDDALATLLAITTREMGVDRCTLFLNDDVKGQLFSRIAEGDQRATLLTHRRRRIDRRNSFSE